MKLSRIIIFTPDVERLAQFYRSAFALEEIGVPNSDWTELDAGSCSLAFHKLEETSTVRDNWIKPVFGASDVSAEKKRLEDLGIEMTDVVSFSDVQLCDGRDPDGNWFQISSRGI